MSKRDVWRLKYLLKALWRRRDLMFWFEQVKKNEQGKRTMTMYTGIIRWINSLLFYLFLYLVSMIHIEFVLTCKLLISWELLMGRDSYSLPVYLPCIVFLGLGIKQVLCNTLINKAKKINKILKKTFWTEQNLVMLARSWWLKYYYN